jgi:hypothetical protein
MAIVKGSLYRATYDVYDGTGALVNPTSAVLTITKPDGTATAPLNPTLPPAQQGHLFVDYLTADEGLHQGFWTTGSPTTTKDFSFNVVGSTGRTIVSLEQARTFLNVSLTDSDEEINDMSAVVTVIIESIVGNVLPKQYVERHDGGECFLLHHGPPIAIVAIDPWYANIGESVPVSEVQIDPVTWSVERKNAFGFYFGPYRVTFTAGRAIVRPNIQHGALVMLDHLWETQRGGSIVGAMPGVADDEAVAYTVAGRSWTVPRSVIETLQPDAKSPLVG